VYLPLVREIREQKMLKRFSNRTEADLYRWMMEQRQNLAVGTPASPGSRSEPSISTAPVGRKRWAEAALGMVRMAMRRLRRSP
jgi:hypothetical protein